MLIGKFTVITGSPMDRLGNFPKSGEAFAFAAGEWASYLNGQCILANGGK